MKQRDRIKTKRLIITAWTDDRLQQARKAAVDAAAMRRYNAMAAGTSAFPTKRLWHTVWEITLRSDGTPIGEAYFMGHPNDCGEAELVCSIDAAYYGRGFGYETIEAMTDWAMRDEAVYYVLTQAADADTLLRKTLTELGYAPAEKFGQQGRIYEYERPHKSMVHDLMSLGVTFGLLLGVLVIGDLTVGVLIGAFAGYAIGSYFDAKDRRIREKLRQKRR